VKNIVAKPVQPLSAIFCKSGVGWRFFKAYLKSMRLYYSFVTGIAGWIGVAYYEYLADLPSAIVEIVPSETKKLLILSLLFLSWGVNQIINDYLGLKEDRINAPQRPMVTGELQPVPALLLTGFLLIFTGGITWIYLEPFALFFLIGGVLLNILYEYAKGYGIWGNITFGLMIGMATLFGGYASGPTDVDLFTSNRQSVLFLVVLLNGLMTYYTYFKDYRGDRKAGKKTLIVSYGLRTSRVHAAVFAFIPTISLLILHKYELLTVELNQTFVILWLAVFCMHLITGILYYLYPTGKSSYSSLGINFQGCVCGQAALIGLFNQNLAIWLFVVSFILVGLLFKLHANHKG